MPLRSWGNLRILLGFHEEYRLGLYLQCSEVTQVEAEFGSCYSAMTSTSTSTTSTTVLVGLGGLVRRIECCGALGKLSLWRPPKESLGERVQELLERVSRQFKGSRRAEEGGPGRVDFRPFGGS